MFLCFLMADNCVESLANHDAEIIPHDILL